MRVLNVGNFYYARQAQLFYVMCRKFTNGLVANGHHVYNFDDRLMARMTNFISTRSVGAKRVNKSFIECCLTFKPDLVWLNFADLIDVETIQKVREKLPETRFANIFLDPLDSQRNRKRVEKYAEVVDASFLTTAGSAFAELSQKITTLHFIPNAVDARVENKNVFAQTGQGHDVFFSVGSYKGSPERVDKAMELSRWLPRARYNYFGFSGVNPVWGAAYFEAIADSRIGLNFSRFEDHYLYTSDRISHYMGNGLLTVFDKASGMEQFFTEEEAIFFSEIEELAEMIDFYLDHDDSRRKVAKAGHDKIHAMHNVEAVCRFIVERTMDLPLSQTYDWPTTAKTFNP